MRVFLLIITAFIFSNTFSQEMEVYLEPSEMDLGEMNAGDTRAFEFVLVNKSSSTISIDDAIVTCGCTVPEWTKEPIYAGSEYVVKGTFDSKHKEGFIRKKVVVVLSNGERLTFSFLVNVLVEE